MINLKSTKNASINKLKLLVYGAAGAGKTTLIRTLPAPLILSAESGLLSLRNENLPYIEITDINMLAEVFEWLHSSTEAAQFESIALDSISEIAEVVLGEEKAGAKDPRQAYGAMQDRMNALIRSFRDLPKHVYFSAKIERMQNEIGQVLYAPSMPGNKLGQGLPYFFDEVFALRIVPIEGQSPERMLMCASDGLWTAKDRSGVLAPWEPADLSQLIKKINGGN